MHRVVCGGGQVVEHRGHEHATGAEPERIHVFGPGDVFNDVQGGEDAGGVGVQVPAGLLRGRVAPAEQKDLQPPADHVFHEAAARPEVEEGEPAGRGGTIGPAHTATVRCWLLHAGILTHT